MVALDGLISDWSRGIDAADLELGLRQAEVPSSRVYTIADIYADPHYKIRNMLLEVPHPDLGHTTQIGVVPRLSATPGSVRYTGPDIGSDTEEVLASLGYGPEQIAALKSAGVTPS